MILEPLRVTCDRDIPSPLLTELTALYASNREYHALSGDFPDPDDIRPEQVAAELADELANPDVEVLAARSEGRLVGVAITLAHHPNPADPDPWIGLLMIDAAAHGQGHGRRIAELLESRFREAGRTAVRLAVLDNNPKAAAFWAALGYEVIDHRRDLGMDRPCTVLRKPLPDPRTPRTPRRAARVVVVDPEGAVFLFRYDNSEVGVHWAPPGGGLEPGESPREGALREVREETGWTDVEPGDLLCAWEHDFTRAGVPVRQYEDVYVAHAPRRDPAGADVASAHAADGILNWRWWAPAELAATDEALWPPRLAKLLAELPAARSATGE